MTENATHDINESLKSNYMLLVLSISKWNASKPDKALAIETASAHGASPEAVKVTKKIMSGADTELKNVDKALNSIRTYVYSVSLPWSSSDEGAKRGPRLIPTAKSLEVIQHLAKLQNEFKDAMTELKAVYSQRVQQAMTNQGSLADPTLYPRMDELDSMFSVRFDLEPVPTVGDFSRMTLPANVAEALGNRMGKRQSKVVENAMADLTTRITAAVGNMAKQLHKHASGEKTRLYTSLVDNVRVLLDLLVTSNLTADAQLSELAEDMKHLVTHDIKTLKDNAGTAKAVADKADAVVKKLTGVTPAPISAPAEVQVQEEPAVEEEPEAEPVVEMMGDQINPSRNETDLNAGSSDEQLDEVFY